MLLAAVDNRRLLPSVGKCSALERLSLVSASSVRLGRAWMGGCSAVANTRWLFLSRSQAAEANRPFDKIGDVGCRVDRQRMTCEAGPGGDV